MRSHSTKFQLKEKSLDANFILSNTLRALLLFKIQKNSVLSVILRSSASLTCRQCAWLDARSPSLLSGASHACVEPSWRRWHAGPPSPASSAASGPLVAADRGRNGGSTLFGAAQRPSALRVASCMPAHARGTVAVARQARNVLPAADRPRHPPSVELTHNAKPQPV